MTSVKNIKIPYNVVLVRVDDDYETYQFKGKDTGLYAPNYSYNDGKRVATPSKNYSVTGKVFGVPEKINFFREEIKMINRNHKLVHTDEQGRHQVVNGHLLREINDLKKKSCRFETDNELCVGDTVKFSYYVHIAAKENNAIFDTEEGKMYFIKYDDIFMTVDEDNKPKKMINGYILVDPDVKETEKDGAMEYEETSFGLVLPKLKEDTKQRRGSKCMEGKVLKSAKPLTATSEEGKKHLGGYFDIQDYNEIDLEVNEGDRILFDPRVAQQLEHEHHQSMSDHKLYMIQRKDILFFEKDNPNFDEIGVTKVNYERI